MDESAFAARLAESQTGVERELEILLSLEPRPGELARPKRLIEAMRYATLGGGKRLRPFLTVETARALGRTDNGPMRAGAAIECIHAYSLIHDDLPSMDDDDLRRGRSRPSPIPRPTQSRKCASRFVWASHEPRVSLAWWAGRCWISTPRSRRRRFWLRRSGSCR